MTHSISEIEAMLGEISPWPWKVEDSIEQIIKENKEYSDFKIGDVIFNKYENGHQLMIITDVKDDEFSFKFVDDNRSKYKNLNYKAPKTNKFYLKLCT